MRVRYLKTFTTPHGAGTEGVVETVPDDLGAWLIAGGNAVEVPATEGTAPADARHASSADGRAVPAAGGAEEARASAHAGPTEDERGIAAQGGTEDARAGADVRALAGAHPDAHAGAHADAQARGPAGLHTAAPDGTRYVRVRYRRSLGDVDGQRREVGLTGWWREDMARQMIEDGGAEEAPGTTLLVRYLRTFAGPEWAGSEGVLADVPDERGRWLISKGFAREASPEEAAPPPVPPGGTPAKLAEGELPPPDGPMPGSQRRSGYRPTVGEAIAIAHGLPDAPTSPPPPPVSRGPTPESETARRQVGTDASRGSR